MLEIFLLVTYVSALRDVAVFTYGITDNTRVCLEFGYRRFRKITKRTKLDVCVTVHHY